MSAAVAQSLSRALAVVSRRGDLAVAAILLVAVAMIIVPLPTGLVNVLITTNLAVSALVLLVAFYAARPTEMSSLPSIILVATLFRLAITISTSRLILLQGDAGEIVTAFGDFVIGGNIAVGLIVFLIITIAQFVVITKGAERVAEVAARFSLDACRASRWHRRRSAHGDIDQAEARRLRTRARAREPALRRHGRGDEVRQRRRHRLRSSSSWSIWSAGSRSARCSRANVGGSRGIVFAAHRRRRPGGANPVPVRLGRGRRCGDARRIE